MLADRYELRRVLGDGPTGEVWEGYDRVLGRLVAVKVIHPQLAADETVRARLRELARDAARVQHPNAAAVHDIDEDGRFVVTELVEGDSVRRLLGDRDALPADMAVRVAAGACSALSAAHAAGVLHRGLKPENLLLTPDGEVKVTDFALAAAIPDPGLAAVRYLAPEQLATGRADDRSDLYALGCCLYEMVTGQPPFDGPTAFAVAAGHLHERPRRPSAVRAGVPAGLEAVVGDALAKDPSDRFQTPAELRQALQRSGAPPPSRPDPSPRRPPAAVPAGPGRAPVTPGRGRLLAVLLAVGLLAGAVAVVVATSQSPTTTPAAGASPAATTRRPASAVSPATSPAATLPSVAGLTQAEATRRLHHLGVRVGAVRRAHNQRVPNGRVVATRPSAGSALQPGQRVTLVVSDGAGPDSVADLVALIDADPRAAGPRAPTFRKRLVRLDTLTGQRRQAELTDLLSIARAGAGNGDFSPSFSAAAVQVLRGLA